MTSREQMLTEQLREALRDVEQACPKVDAGWRPDVACWPEYRRAAERVAALEMALAESCPTF